MPSILFHSPEHTPQSRSSSNQSTPASLPQPTHHHPLSPVYACTRAHAWMTHSSAGPIQRRTCPRDSREKLAFRRAVKARASLEKNLSSIHTRGEKKTRAANDEAVRLTALRVYKATLDPAYSAAQFPLLSGILSLPFPRRQRANRLARCVYRYLQPAARPALASPVRMTLSRGGNGGRPAVWRMRPGKWMGALECDAGPSRIFIVDHGGRG